MDLRLGIFDYGAQPLGSELAPKGAGPEGVLITFHLKVSDQIRNYLARLKEVGIHLAEQTTTTLPDGWGSVLVYGGSEAQVEFLRELNTSPEWEDWATAMPCSALFREVDPTNKQPSIINLSLNSKFAIDHSFIREIFKHAAYNWITPFDVRVFTGLELTVEGYAEIIKNFVKTMERKGGMGKFAYGNAVHSINGNGEARCLINPPLLTSAIWGTAIPADLDPPMGLTQGVFVLGLSPDLGVPLCCLLCRSLGIPETEIMKATWGVGSGNVHVLHFPEITKTTVEALVESTSACSGIRATLSLKSRIFKRGHTLVPATWSLEDLAAFERARKENRVTLTFPASPFKPRYLLSAAQEARQKTRASEIPADQVARKDMWITSKLPGATASRLTSVNEEPATAEGSSDRAVAEVEAGSGVQSPLQVFQPPEDGFLAPKKVQRLKGITPPIANFFGSNNLKPQSDQQIEAGKSLGVVKTSVHQKQVLARAAQREAAVVKKKVQKAAEKEKGLFHHSFAAHGSPLQLAALEKMTPEEVTEFLVKEGVWEVRKFGGISVISVKSNSFIEANTQALMDFFFDNEEPRAIYSRANGVFLGISKGFCVGDGGPFLILEADSIPKDAIVKRTTAKYFDTLLAASNEKIYHQKKNGYWCLKPAIVSYV